MSNAADKNGQAFKALFGNAALADRLNSTRIAVVTPPDDLPHAGKLLGEVLADVLARLWPNIDFIGSGARTQLASAQNAAISGGGTGDGLKIRWVPPYDCIISIGCDTPTEGSYLLKAGADGWAADLGPEARCGSDTNPVGPAFAAAMVGAQVFHHVFEPELVDMGIEPLDQCSIDIRTLFDVPDITTTTLDLGEIHVFGVGAVTHGLVWLLEHWTEPVFGEMHLIDQDRYGHSNGQRYAFMQPQDLGVAKVDAVRTRLYAAHPNLMVTSHITDLNTYCAIRGYDSPLSRVIVGLDSTEARRHVALKLPERVVNMWTEGVRVGAGRYLPGDNRACLACDYLEKLETPLDEVAELYLQIGIFPNVIRSLLDSGRGLNEQEAAQVASRWNVPPTQFVGQPLRSVMPMLCATGKLQLPNATETTDVPFAFASLFAGIAGFVMLLKDSFEETNSSNGWTQHIFKRPTHHMYRSLYSNKECVCCTEMKHQAIEV